MKPQITEPISLKLLGSVFYGNPFHSHEGGSIQNEIGRLWERFGTKFAAHVKELEKIIVENGVGWEVHIQTEEYPDTKDYTIFAGIEVSKPSEVPVDFFYKQLPTTKYAVFQLKGNDFVNGLDYVYNNWLPNSEYKESHGYMLWRYDEKCRDLSDPDCVLEAYIPVEAKKVD